MLKSDDRAMTKNGRGKLGRYLRLRGGLHTATIGLFGLETRIYDRVEEK